MLPRDIGGLDRSRSMEESSAFEDCRMGNALDGPCMQTLGRHTSLRLARDTHAVGSAAGGCTVEEAGHVPGPGLELLRARAKRAVAGLALLQGLLLRRRLRASVLRLPKQGLLLVARRSKHCFDGRVR
jgi:hypothetical protein